MATLPLGHILIGWGIQPRLNQLLTGYSVETCPNMDQVARPGRVHWPWLESWRAFTLPPAWMRWPKMITANPADWGHASWASDEAWRWGLARRPKRMGGDCHPPGRSLKMVRRGGSWSSYVVALMASGWDPLHVLPVMQLRTGRVGPGVKEIQMDGHQLVLKPSQEFALTAAKQLPWV